MLQYILLDFIRIKKRRLIHEFHKTVKTGFRSILVFFPNLAV